MSRARFQRLRKKNDGFTLIELMIVIAIIGVLAAIAVPNFKSAREKANTKACWANQKTLAGALEMYNLDNNTNVATLDESVATNLKGGGYLQDVPKDPGGDNTWNYQMQNGIISCSKHGAIGSTGNTQAGGTPRS